MNIERGERHVESGDPAGAFLFFHQAAAQDPAVSSDWRHWFWRLLIFRPAFGDDSAGELHRLRLGATWWQLPHLQHLLQLPELTHTSLSPKGDYLAGSSSAGLRLWHLVADGSVQESNPLGNRPQSRVTWASFSNDPEQPLLAVAMFDSEGDGKSVGQGQVIVYDPRSKQPVGEPIRLAEAVPQRMWFNPQASEQLLVISQPASGQSGEVSLWNFRTGQRIAGPKVYSSPVNWAGFSRDGSLVVTAAGELGAGKNGEARIWHWSSDEETALQHDGGPLAYAEFAQANFEEEGGRVVTAEGTNEGSAGAARVWRVVRRETAPHLQTEALTAPLTHRGGVTRARFSPDGLWVATSSRDRTARLWHVRTQKEVLGLEHNGDVNDAVFSPDGRFLATAGRDRNARIWEVATGRLAQAPLNHSETVSEVAYSEDGRSLVTTSKHLSRLWAANRNEPKTPTLKAEETKLTAVSGDGQHVLTVGGPKEMRTVALWRTATGERVATTTLANAERLQLAISSDGSRFAIASRDPAENASSVRLFQLPPGGNASLQETSRIENDLFRKSDIVSLAFDAERGRVAVVLRKDGGMDTQVAICDTGTGAVRVLPGLESALVSRIQFSPKGTYLLACFTQAGSSAGRARLWMLDGNPAGPSELQHETEITTAAFSPDERALLTGSTDDNARRWSISNGKVGEGAVLRDATANTHTADLTCVLFSPDGREALTAAKDQTAILWDLTSDEPGGKRIAVLQHSAYVNDAIFSREKKVLLTSSGEPKLRAWSSVTGELLALFNPTGEVLRAGFAPEGRGIFAIGQAAARSAPIPGSLTDAEPPVRDVRLMNWSFAPLNLEAKRVSRVGTLVAARKIDDKTLAKAVTEELPKIWQSEGGIYRSLFPAARDPAAYHQAAVDECEATKQWSAAAWHYTRLEPLREDPAARATLLVRRAQAYAEADNWPDALPKVILDYEKAISLRPDRAADYIALGRAHLDYGIASGKIEYWDRAIGAFREASKRNPRAGEPFRRAGEAFAGKRDFAQADKEFRQARELGDSASMARLALVGRLMGTPEGNKQYLDACTGPGDVATLNSLIWSSFLTDAFENNPFGEELVRRAEALVTAHPENLYHRNTLGAVLYRAGQYERAILELEKARAAYLAQRASEASQKYDHPIRLPIARPMEGRPQDCIFLAMAKARLGPERRSEAWDWMRKAMDAPELAQTVKKRREGNTLTPERAYPVSYAMLGLELLFDEAWNLLRAPASTGP